MLIKLLLWLNLIEVSAFQFRIYKENNAYPPIFNGWSCWEHVNRTKFNMLSEYLKDGVKFEKRKLYTFK